jgi:hypothetical protein
VCLHNFKQFQVYPAFQISQIFSITVQYQIKILANKINLLFMGKIFPAWLTHAVLSFIGLILEAHAIIKLLLLSKIILVACKFI